MINERYQVSGISIDSGERAQGWYYEISKGAWVDPIQNGSYITVPKRLENGEIILSDIHEIDPSTIEPVRVKPTKTQLAQTPEKPNITAMYACPNCNGYAGYGHKFCLHCGMALDWSE